MNTNNRKALYDAMANAQKRYAGKLEADKKGNYGTYTTVGALYGLARMILLEEGLLLFHFSEVHVESGNEIEVTQIVHRETGELVEDKRFNISEKPGNQGRGASSTYMKRYALKALLAIDMGEDDDDGQGEQDWLKKTISSQSVAKITNKIREYTGKEREIADAIYATFKISKLADLKNSQLGDVYKFIERFK